MGAFLVHKALQRRIPKGESGTQTPEIRIHIHGPDFAHGGRCALVAAAVIAHKTNDLRAVQRHLHLRLGVLDGLRPIALALGQGHDGHVQVAQHAFERFFHRGVVQLGNGFGIAGGGGTDVENRGGHKLKRAAAPWLDKTAPIVAGR